MSIQIRSNCKLSVSDAVARTRGTALGALLAAVALVGGACGEDESPPMPPSPQMVVLSAASTRIEIGQPLTITAVVRDTRDSVINGAVVQWTAVPSAIATVANGVVTAVAPGTATITARSNTAVASINVDVVSPTVATVKLTAPVQALAPAQQTTVVADVRDARQVAITGRAVAWSSSNSGVATIDNTGRLTGVAVGAAYVYGLVDGVRDSLAITVTGAAPTLVILPNELTVFVGKQLPVTARLRDANGVFTEASNVTWQSDNPAFFTINSAGVISAINAGSTQLRATSGTFTASVPVQIRAAGIPYIYTVAANETSTQTGEIRADSINIAGVIAPTGQLTLIASGGIVITGRILSPCYPITIISGGKFVASTTGPGQSPIATIDNTCADGLVPVPLPALRIESSSYHIRGAKFRLGGDFSITNAPGMLIQQVTGAPIDRDQIPCILDFASVNSQTMTTAAAIAGRDGQFGGPGLDGSRIVVECRGSLKQIGFTWMQTRPGGTGGKGTHASTGNAYATGGAGGRAGSLRFWVTGDLILENYQEISLSVNGAGAGGNATATTTSEEGASAVAVAGRGGDIGQPNTPPIDFRIAGALVRTDPSANRYIELNVWNAGQGGIATAIAGNGSNATATTPAKAGGAATAVGGGSGAVYQSPVAFGTPVRPTDVLLLGSYNSGGGGANATAGSGGAGSSEFPNGAPGGDVRSIGGESLGSAVININGTGPTGGNGGAATFGGGNGGAGFSRCAPGGSGGAGGPGGILFGGGGKGGQGRPAPGVGGAVSIVGSGSGGAGGNGTTPGVGGNKGPDQTTAPGAKTLTPPSLTNGANGVTCTP